MLVLGLTQTFANLVVTAISAGKRELKKAVLTCFGGVRTTGSPSVLWSGQHEIHEFAAYLVRRSAIQQSIGWSIVYLLRRDAPILALRIPWDICYALL